MHSSFRLPPDGNSLILTQPVLQTFLSYRQHLGQNESGGILLGRVSLQGSVTVEIATIPTVLDKAGPAFFVRSREAAQCVVDRAWSISSGEQVYLGEWHTHSECSPKPSTRDKDMIRNMFLETSMEISFLFTVIVGRSDEWVGMQTKRRLFRLTSLVSHA